MTRQHDILRRLHRTPVLTDPPPEIELANKIRNLTKSLLYLEMKLPKSIPGGSFVGRTLEAVIFHWPQVLPSAVAKHLCLRRRGFSKCFKGPKFREPTQVYPRLRCF